MLRISAPHCRTPPNRWLRVKTIKTTLEKLARQPHLKSIAQIRDFAGLRVVVHDGRSAQDDVARRIAALFPDATRPPKFIDRRADPRAGYRAVHLEVRRDGVAIEVQIRTSLQHRWAELFERAADRLGRGLRYGEQVAGITPGTPIAGLVRALQLAADLIDQFERVAEADPESMTMHNILDELAQLLERLP
jgi:ppGpp synthetase/RelA/SpoT-type nucleotidyltranferase